MPINFPHGLYHGGFRSSVDALLLAGFARQILLGQKKSNNIRFIDLGSGSGMVSLALAQQCSHIQGMGVDIQEKAIEAAILNAQLMPDVNNLQLANRLCFFCADIQEHKEFSKLCTQQNFLNCDFVLANPPYHDAKKGRISPHAERSQALHSDAQCLKSFCTAARIALKHKGHFCIIFSPSRILDLANELQAQSFGIRRILPVYTRANREAQWVLIQARKDTKNQVSIEPFLQLYADAHIKEYSSEALSFCPWLT